MFKQWINTLIIAVMVVTTIFSLRQSSADVQAEQVNPQNNYSEQIQEVIERSYEIEFNAGQTFDTSLFNTVYINDLRGGELSKTTEDFIISVTGGASLLNYGYLDYKLAYYFWWKNGAIKFEEIKAKAENEKRDLTQEEMISLIDDKGRMAMPRLQGEYFPIQLHFISIDIEGDQAIVQFDDGPRTNEMILVKINNNWFIAGNKFLSIHP